MTATAGLMLVSRIMPILQGAIARGVVRPVGAEDPVELTQDCLAAAASMLHAAESAGKTVTPNNIVFYVLQNARSGRRSTSSSRVDVLGAACQMDKHSTVISMDAPLGVEADDDDTGTLHDLLASSYEDTDAHAARRLDWDLVQPVLDRRERQILRETAEEMPVQTMAEMHGVTAPRIVQIKRQMGTRIQDVWDADTVVAATQQSQWRRHVAAYQESRACRRIRNAA